MRILNLQEFLALPSGVIYAKYKPCIFGPLMVKYQTDDENNITTSPLHTEVDMFDTGDFVVKLTKAENDSSYSIPLDLEATYGESIYDTNQLFAVYEQKDIDQLIAKLQQCKGIDKVWIFLTAGWKELMSLKKM